jgi:hypothetical protein
VIKRSSSRWLSTSVIALGLCCCAFALPWASAQEQMLRWSRDEKNDSRAIRIDSDTASTWFDGGKRVFLAKGKVCVEQGGAVLRADQAVIWVDEAYKKRTGIYRIAVYAEGQSSLDLGSEVKHAGTAYIELTTRGTVGPLKFFKAPLAEKAEADDPLFKRAVACQAALPPTSTASSQAVQPAVAVSRTAPADFSGIQQVQNVQPGTLVPPSTLPAPPSAAQQPGVAPGQLPLPPVMPPAIPPYDVVPTPDADRIISIRPRSSAGIDIQETPLPDGTKASILSPGVIISIVEYLKTDPTKPRTTVIEADRVVVWTKGDIHAMVQGIGGAAGSGPAGPKQASATEPPQTNDLEFYLSGNVEIRNQITKDTRVIHCSEAYYDVNRHVSISRDANFIIQDKTIQYPIYLVTPELRMLNESLYAWDKSSFNASTLPYGPGLEVTTGKGTMTDQKVPKRGFWGLSNVYVDPKTGKEEIEEQRIVRTFNAVPWLEGIPIFYWPYLQCDATDPLGPLHSIGGGYSKIFGIEAFVTWNGYDLLGIDPGQGTHWYLNTDYMSLRGPAMGTDYTINNYGDPARRLFDVAGKYEINVKGYFINDSGVDVLGGNRGQFEVYGDPNNPSILPITHPDWRGRFLAQLNWQEMPDGFSILGQVAAISDRNFLDQYFNQDWLNGANEETFAQVKQQKDDWAWDVLMEVRDRNWITETGWLPKAAGYVIGQDFLDYFSWNSRASAGYAILSPAHQQPTPFEPTDIGISTSRADWFNEVSVPFQLGALKVVPYGVLDLTYYSNDLDYTGQGRVYDGGGVRASIPLSRLFPDVQSDLFNVNGIYHKIVLSEDFYWVHSNVSHLMLPQLDRLNDDASDQALRDIHVQQPALNPANAAFLNSGYFDPQLYALRKLVLSAVDTLDSIEVVQLDLKQRLQTKRGLPGQEHIIDWMTLDVGVSLYPQANRDDNGRVVNFITYDWTWAIGDRTTLYSSGWFDPYPNAGRVWNFGVDFSRPDGSALSLVYRQIDPLESKQVTASIALPFSSKYSITASTSYDFGVNTQNNSLTINRKGSDLTLALGVSYDSILNNVGFIFELYPNVLPQSAVPGANLFSSGLAQGR